jgi:hypothetical protein
MLIMRHQFIQLSFFIISIFSFISAAAQPKPQHNLKFNTLSKRWDEGIPLGNRWLGALIWQKGNNIRVSLDRVDLWDDRPMPEIDKLKFNWVVAQVKKGNTILYKKLAIILMINTLLLQKSPGLHWNLIVRHLER